MAGCPTEAELLDAIEGRLPEADRQRVNAHVEGCDACAELLESLTGASLSSADPLLGVMLGEYLIEERIGQGGMGVVYRARQPVIGKQVAVKLLRGAWSHDKAAVQRLITEAQVVNAIGHRGIIDIFSFGQAPDGRRYFVMEYLVGAPLDEYLRATGKLTPFQTLTLLDELLAALAAAHGAGVVHRDLKPSNLFLVTQPDGTKFMKVLDFGLSRVKSRSDTTTGALVGTPAYMAPELIRSEEVGPWTDLYAVGVLAWQLLAGRKPFEERSIAALLRKQLEAPPPSLAEHAKGVPAPVEAFVMSLLAKDPRKRPASTAEARAEVRRMLHALSTEKTMREEPDTVDEKIPPSAMGRLPHPVAALADSGPRTDREMPAIDGPRLTPNERPRVRDTSPDTEEQGGVLAKVRKFLVRWVR